MHLQPGTIVPLKRSLGDAYAAESFLAHVLVLVQPQPPFNAHHPEVRVAPISIVTGMKSDLDVLCYAGEGLDSDVVIEVWNQRAMLVEELDLDSLRQVSDVVLSQVYAVHSDMLGHALPVPIVPDRVGPPIEFETDPRIAYQEMRAHVAEALSVGADRLIAPVSAEQPSLRSAYHAVQDRLLGWHTVNIATWSQIVMDSPIQAIQVLHAEPGGAMWKVSSVFEPAAMTTLILCSDLRRTPVWHALSDGIDSVPNAAWDTLYRYLPDRGERSEGEIADDCAWRPSARALPHTVFCTAA